jgi:hypothetical protein
VNISTAMVPKWADRFAFPLANLFGVESPQRPHAQYAVPHRGVGENPETTPRCSEIDPRTCSGGSLLLTALQLLETPHYLRNDCVDDNTYLEALRPQV